MRRPPRPSTVPPAELPIVLLAEDDDELRRLLARRLRRQGYDVIEARTGVQLVELVAEHGMEPVASARPLALVISDVRMPGRSGLDVLRLMRRAGVTAPVVLITGFSASELQAEATALGALVLDKPVDLDELAATASRLLASSRAT